MKIKITVSMLLTVFLALGSYTAAAEEPTPASGQSQEPFAAPIAILPFTAKSTAVKDQGGQISDILLMGLETDGRFTMVSREELGKILDEQQLSASGLVSAETKNKIGQLTGAKILITGSVFKSDSKTYVIAKVIGVETSQVVGCGISGTGSGAELGEELAAKVVNTLITKGKELLPKPMKQTDLIAELKAQAGDVSGVSVYINVKEEVLNTVDPALQTELQAILTGVGFTLTENKNNADYAIIGEAFAENGGKINAFFSGVARAEVRVYGKNGKIIMVDRQKEVVPALSINIACKDALQQAGMRLAKRVIPILKKGR